MMAVIELLDLEARRERLRADLSGIGDFRPGSLSAVMRRCGKANCACAGPEHSGHGPRHVLTRKRAGKTAMVHLRPGPELERARVEVANYKRFKQIVDELIEVNAAICAARPVSPLAEHADGEQRDERGGPAGQKRAPRGARAGVRRRSDPPGRTCCPDREQRPASRRAGWAGRAGDRDPGGPSGTTCRRGLR